MIILYILFVLLALIVVLLLIALINTIRIKDTDMSTFDFDIDPKKSELYAKELSELIKVETLSYDIKKDNAEPFRNMHTVMQKIFHNVYHTLEKLFPIQQIFLLHFLVIG